MAAQIFISYRREDTAASSGRLSDRLSNHFPSNQIFMDVDNVDLGEDFVKTIEKTVRSCDVLIAVIGKGWLNSCDQQGQRRLDTPEDFVRIEIATALKRDIRVIPVLVDGAAMPRSGDLPDDLKPLVRRNALQLSHDRFRTDSERLASAVERALETAKAEQQCKREEEQRLKTNLVFQVQPVVSEEKLLIGGRVTNEKGEPIIGAKISIFDGETEIAGMDSDPDGKFKFSSEIRLATPRLKIVVTAQSFEPLERSNGPINPLEPRKPVAPDCEKCKCSILLCLCRYSIYDIRVANSYHSISLTNENGPLRFTQSSGAEVYCPWRVSIAAIQRRWREGVLCSLLLSPRDVLDLCQIKLRPEAFYAPAHQILFNLVAELVDSNKPIDFITLKQALKDRNSCCSIIQSQFMPKPFLLNQRTIKPRIAK